MVDAPERYFDELREAGLDKVSFHLEAVPEPAPAIAKARAAGLGVGLTLNLETPVEVAFRHLEDVDDVMLMSIPPGWSGQTLDTAVYPRLTAVRDEIDRRGRAVDVEVDGGVKIGNAQRAVDAGANVLVAASGLFAQPDPAEAARRFVEIVGAA
jgi:ribulose-phosphate 3-epimerase